MKSLDPGAKWSFRLAIYPSLIIILIFLSFMGPLSLVAFLLIFLGLGELYTKLSYKNWKYELSKKEIKIEKGIIWKKYYSIPYSKVQNIEIHRGILGRTLGFSSILIHTAGYSGGYTRSGHTLNRPEGYLLAVSIKEAENIRSFLIKKIRK